MLVWGLSRCPQPLNPLSICLHFVLCCCCVVPHSDKSVIVWHLERSETQYGFPKRSLIGHNHYVQVCAVGLQQSALAGHGSNSLQGSFSISLGPG